MGVGSPEYVLLFRKPQSDRTRGYADVPVRKDKADYSRARWQIDAHAYWRSSGNRVLVPADMDGLTTAERMRIIADWSAAGLYDYEVHVSLGEHIDAKGQLPAKFMAIAPGSNEADVWTDVLRMRTLNNDQSRRDQQQHLCPLPIDIVDRLIVRYSNHHDLVYDPFGGLGTVPLRALLQGRRGRGVELNPGYFRDAVKYLQAAEAKLHLPTLFDLIDIETTEVPA